MIAYLLLQRRERFVYIITVFEQIIGFFKTLRQVLHVATTGLNSVACAIDVPVFCFPLI